VSHARSYSRSHRQAGLLRWAQLLTAIMPLSESALVPPGFGSKGRVTCPVSACGAVSRRLTDRSAKCANRHLFIWCRCPAGNGELAVSFGNRSWSCEQGHEFENAVLCPECWSLSLRSDRSSKEWICQNAHTHRVYLRKTSCRCQYSLQVALAHAKEWICVACDRTYPIER
jgi:hypothetical protein